MLKKLFNIMIASGVLFLAAGGIEETKAFEQAKQIKIFVNLDKGAKGLGINSPQITGKVSISFLQKGIKPVFINEKESEQNDHLRIDVSTQQKLVWVTVSYIKVFKFKFRGSYAYESGVMWSGERSSLVNTNKSYLEFIDILVQSFLTEHYYLVKS